MYEYVVCFKNIVAIVSDNKLQLTSAQSSSSCRKTTYNLLFCKFLIDTEKY